MNLECENGIEVAGVEIADHVLARIGWLLPLLTVSISMLVHALSGDARALPFFISESDYPGLQRWIFTTGLSICGVLLCIIAYRFRYLFKDSEKSKRIHISFYSGMTTGISIIILAFANMYDFLLLHCVVAITVFGGGFIWGYSTHLLFEKTETFGKQLRRIGLGMAAFALVTMNAILITYIGSHRDELNNGDSLLYRLDTIQSAIDYAAPAEYILFLGLVITLAAFEPDLKAKIQSKE
jgi:hypothetical protein